MDIKQVHLELHLYERAYDWSYGEDLVTLTLCLSRAGSTTALELVSRRSNWGNKDLPVFLIISGTLTMNVFGGSGFENIGMNYTLPDASVLIFKNSYDFFPLMTT